MDITSPVFRDQQWIPKRYTGAGENVSPPLRWSGEPKGCESFAIICEDPDAPLSAAQTHPFIHWIAYNISPSVSALPEGIDAKSRLELPVALDQGLNSFGKIGYGGPLPPIGHGTHHYRFKIYALNAPLGIPPGASLREFQDALANHVLATAEITGLYERDLNQSVMT